MTAKPKKLAITAPLDRAKVRSALRQLDRDILLEMLDSLIEWMEPGQLAALVGEQLPVESLYVVPDLVVDVESFCRRSRNGEYYEDFRVNSKNYMLTSPGTDTFIAECRRLFDRCVEEAGATEPARLRSALKALFELLRAVDECNDDIVFFADEGGSWQVGVDDRCVLPVWFACLAATAEPEEFAREALAAIDDLAGSHQRPAYVKLVRAAASPGQRKVLDELVKSGKGQQSSKR